MKTKNILIAAALAVLGMTTMTAAAYAGEQKPQTKCPVMGGDIDKSLHVDAQGKRIYVCCPGCIDAVKANPEKYIKEMESQGITLDKAK